MLLISQLSKPNSTCKDLSFGILVFTMPLCLPQCLYSYISVISFYLI